VFIESFLYVLMLLFLIVELCFSDKTALLRLVQCRQGYPTNKDSIKVRTLFQLIHVKSLIRMFDTYGLFVRRCASF